MNDHRTGGHKLRELRQARQWTQRDVERETKGAVPSQQVSRIENGAVADPSMKDLVALGRIYGLTPNEVAELYGYWRAPGGENARDFSSLSTLNAIERLLAASSPETAAQYLDYLDLLMRGIAAKERNAKDRDATN